MGRLFWIFLVLTFGSACHSGREQETTLRMSLLKGPSAIAFAHLLDSAGTVNGKQVQITLYDNPAQIQALMTRGEVDIAVLPITSAANLYNKGIDYRIIGCPIWGNLFWVSSPLKKGSAAREELFLFGQGTVADMLARYLLPSSGVRLNYTYDSGASLVQALLSGQASQALLPEPFVSIAMQKDSSLFILADMADDFCQKTGATDGFAQTAVVVSGRLDSDKNTVRELNAIFKKACNLSREKPEATGDILRRYGLLPQDIDAAPVIERCRIGYMTVVSARKSIEELLDLCYLYQPKSIGGKKPDDRFYLYP